MRTTKVLQHQGEYIPVTYIHAADFVFVAIILNIDVSVRHVVMFRKPDRTPFAQCGVKPEFRYLEGLERLPDAWEEAIYDGTD